MKIKVYNQIQIHTARIQLNILIKKIKTYEHDFIEESLGFSSVKISANSVAVFDQFQIQKYNEYFYLDNIHCPLFTDLRKLFFFFCLPNIDLQNNCDSPSHNESECACRPVQTEQAKGDWSVKYLVHEYNRDICI